MFKQTAHLNLLEDDIPAMVQAASHVASNKFEENEFSAVCTLDYQ